MGDRGVQVGPFAWGGIRNCLDFQAGIWYTRKDKISQENWVSMHASKGTFRTPTTWSARRGPVRGSCLVLTLAVVSSVSGLSHAKVVINELMASNSRSFSDPQGDFDDWVELYNAGDALVNVGGMYLSDDPKVPKRWQIPLGNAGATTLGPGGYLWIWMDGQTGDYQVVPPPAGTRTTGPPASGFHAGFRLNAKGGGVYLFGADGVTLIDSLLYPQQTSDISYGRYPDGGDTLRFFGEPTPGKKNNEGYLGEVAPLRFSHERGLYSPEVTRLGGAPGIDLTITTDTPGARIVYTLDGVAPDATQGYRIPPGKTYTGPIRITKTTCVRAMAFKDGYKPTRIHTRTYFFENRPELKTLPILSLVGDPGNTFYEPNGVMAIVGGTYSGGVWTSTGVGSYNNILNRDLERPVSVEWITPGDDEEFQVDCGLRVHGSPWMRPRYVRQNGQWSGDGKISFRLYFRGRYGPSELEYPLFPLSTAEEFETIVLRAGHNDRTNPFIKDELLRRLHRDMGQVACMGTFANLTINGEYKGYYNITEHVKEESCRRWFNSDKPWDVMTMNGIRDGDSASWDAMIAYARNYNMSNPAYYAELCKKLDVVCFIDYLIIRLWPNDWDWPQNNWSAACERSETGRWKFFVWDAEGTFESGQLNTDRFPQLNSDSSGNGILYRALKANKDFRLLFADRLYKHFFNGGALTQQNVNRRFNELRSELVSVIPNMNTYIVDTWTPSRQSIFLEACVREGMYTFAGPTFTVGGTTLPGGNVNRGDWLRIVPSPQGAPVYYTLDGSDPVLFDASQTSTEIMLVAPGAAKRVLVPTGPDVGDWRSVRSFDDSAWLSSSGEPGGVGYERSSGYENHISLDVGSRMYNLNGSCYIRIPFQFDGQAGILDTMTLKMQYDDGFIAYLNGVEIARRNFDGLPAWNSVAGASHSDDQAVLFESIDVSASLPNLRQGANMLAIQGLNAGVSSSDFLINVQLVAGKTPANQNPSGEQLYRGPIPLTRSVRVKARTQSGNLWSALADAVFAVGSVKESLRISEIQYHPSDDVPDTEYLELTNIGTETINLNLVRFTRGIDFTFSDVELAPGAFCLVVQNREAFEALYGHGLPIAGQYAGRLSNSGERIELVDARGDVIQSFSYRDDWYDITDGGGFSLTVIDPAGTPVSLWNNRSAWRPSAGWGGSPGRSDAGEVPDPGAVVISELLANSSGVGPDWIELRNTTSRPIDIGGWFLSDDNNDRTKYQIAQGTILPPAGLLVFDEVLHFGNIYDPGCRKPFGLSAAGEAVYLHSGFQGNLTGYSEQGVFGPSEPAVAFERYESLAVYPSLVPAAQATPGRPNAGPQVGPVVINEILYRSDGTTEVEYVELYNISDVNVVLYDFHRGTPWRFTDDPQDPQIDLLFPSDPPITLGPHGYMLLVKDASVFLSRFTVPASTAILSWGAGRLSNSGQTIQLLRPGDLDDKGARSWIVVDRIRYSDGSRHQDFPGGVDLWPNQANGQGLSLSRIAPGSFGDDPSNWQALTPSPGTARPRSWR
ncbi:MAG TPA: lamin tail domain-containing protein [Sedimentisphaerales bacterium]|nr:lamin tail domain-containing protein [Sedimentisphaerales bacterium]